MPYEIERGIPAPKPCPKKLYEPHEMPSLKYRPNRNSLTQALREMIIGDSIFVADRAQETVMTLCSALARVSGWRYVTRKMNGGRRVWRVQ